MIFKNYNLKTLVARDCIFHMGWLLVFPGAAWGRLGGGLIAIFWRFFGGIGSFILGEAGRWAIILWGLGSFLLFLNFQRI